AQIRAERRLVSESPTREITGTFIVPVNEISQLRPSWNGVNKSSTERLRWPSACHLNSIDQLQQSEVLSLVDRVGSRSCLKLVENVDQVGFDRCLRDEQGLGDLLISCSGGKLDQYILFALG